MVTPGQHLPDLGCQSFHYSAARFLMKFYRGSSNLVKNFHGTVEMVDRLSQHGLEVGGECG